MRTEMAIRTTGVPASALAHYGREQIEVLKTLICPGASDTELELFAQVCQRTGLDPMARQIYGIMRGERKQVDSQWKTVQKLSIQTSIDGFRLIADRSGKYGGQVGPQWCGPDGAWRDVWLAGEYPSAARVGVIRTDWSQPLWAVARWDSYVQKFTPKDGQEVIGAMWARMPDVMLAKVAESLALRRAFPAEMSGLYTSDEMAQADEAPQPVARVQTVVEAEAAPARSGAFAEGFQPPSPHQLDAWSRGVDQALKLGLTIGSGIPNVPENPTHDDYDAALGALREAVSVARAKAAKGSEDKRLAETATTPAPAV